jgi:RNA polymerase sigma-70 factor (ECF subfamily)
VPAADQAQAAPGFSRVYDDNVWRVYGFLGYRLGSRLDAEDLTQQTFERALRSWERFDPDRGSHETWLLSIARNLLIDHYRRDRSGSERPLPEEGEATGLIGHAPSPEDSIGIEPELEAALGVLDQRARELVALRFGGDLNGPEIAELTGLSVANVQQILSRSLRALRLQLQGPGVAAQAESGPAPARPRTTSASSSPPEPA